MPNDNYSVVQVRLTGAEKRRAQAAATEDGRTVSEWLRALLKRGLGDPRAPMGEQPDSPKTSRRHEARRRK
jgi:hypothetical protein